MGVESFHGPPSGISEITSMTFWYIFSDTQMPTTGQQSSAGILYSGQVLKS